MQFSQKFFRSLQAHTGYLKFSLKIISIAPVYIKLLAFKILVMHD